MSEEELARVPPAYWPVVVPAAGAAVLLEHKPMAYYVPLFLGWGVQLKDFSESTVRAYGNALRQFVQFCEEAGVYDPAVVKVRHIEAHLSQLRHGGPAKSLATVAQHLHAVRSFWHFLRHQEIVTTNPAADAIGPRIRHKIPDFFTLTEQHTILSTLAAWATRPLRAQAFALTSTGLLTGLRVSELGHLKIEDLHLEDRMLKVTQGKGRRDRLVTAPSWLVRVLRYHLDVARPRFRYAERVPYVFVGRSVAATGQPADARSLYAIIRSTLSPIVGRRCHPHMLRHSFAVRCLSAGADLESIRHAMGHASINTTSRYLHIPTETLKANMERWLSAGLKDDLAADLLDCANPTPEPPPAPPVEDLRLDDVPLVTLAPEEDADQVDIPSLDVEDDDWPAPPSRLVQSIKDRAFRERLRAQRRARR